LDEDLRAVPEADFRAVDRFGVAGFFVDVLDDVLAGLFDVVFADAAFFAAGFRAAGFRGVDFLGVDRPALRGAVRFVDLAFFAMFSSWGVMVICTLQRAGLRERRVFVTECD
jgi:hypothetical protein